MRTLVLVDFVVYPAVCLLSILLVDVNRISDEGHGISEFAVAALVSGLGGFFIVGRAAHAWGWRIFLWMFFTAIGTIGTYFIILLASVGIGELCMGILNLAVFLHLPDRQAHDWLMLVCVAYALVGWLHLRRAF